MLTTGHRESGSREVVAPAATSRARQLVGYLGGTLTKWQRVVVGVVGAVLLPVMFVPILPVWRIFLVAPQYREGLEMRIYANDLQGDLNNINILNHYIGMRHISPESFPEFGYLPWVLSVFGVVAIAAAISGRRWAAFLGWLGFAAFGTVMMLHFAAWMQDYGNNLDPKAALDFGAFTPPLLGTVKRGNFTVRSFPDIGGYILIAAGLLGPILAAADLGPRLRRRAATTAALVAAFLLVVPGNLEAGEFRSYAPKPAVSPLQALVEAAAAGDTVRLPDGVHRGQLVVDRPLTLIGSTATILDGDARGTVVVVRAAGTVLRGFAVRGSGSELLVDDAGILVDEADDVVIEDVQLDDTNHGIYVRNASRVTIRGCRLMGRRGRVREENHGNGIHIWYAKDAVLESNRVCGHRDGVYLSFAETARIEHNEFSGLDRFGLHSMYSQRIIVSHNLCTNNTAGVALMFSNRMTMEGNLFAHNRGHRTYGLLLRDCSDSDFRYNHFIDNTIALFFDGSNRNRFTENLVAENGWGLIAFSSSENNVFTRNAFLDNDYQVSLDMRRTKNRFDDGRFGNYWSDARPYDLDGDGIGDQPFQPVGLFAFVSKQYPDLTVFAGSPALVALDLAQRSLPVLQMTDLVDRYPLITAPVVPRYAGPPAAEPSSGRAGRSFLVWAPSALALGGGLLLARRT